MLDSPLPTFFFGYGLGTVYTSVFFMCMAQLKTRIKLLAKIQTNITPFFKFIRYIIYYIIIGT
jgi:hypothetical protein